MTDSEDNTAALVEALRDPDCYDDDVDSVDVVETHISWIVLAGAHAYKIKKPVKLPFADFSTLAKRRAMCDEEIRLNRRLAPALYLDVTPIGGSMAAPRVAAEPAIEYAVRMKRFRGDARLDAMIEQHSVERGDLRRLAETLAAFHAGLDPDIDTPEFGSAATIIASASDNVDELAELAGDSAARLQALVRWTRREAERLRACFDARKAAGRVREGHGDLHSENLVWLDGEIAAFDALEFNPELRWSDVINEASFLTMDLSVRRRPDLAYAFMNRYLEASGDYDGVTVLRFYLVYRALVRAKVRAIARRQHDEPPLGHSNEYLDYAARAIGPGPPRLILTHGLSGSGKTTITSGLLGTLPAIRIRSDLERKRLFGLAETDSSDAGIGERLYSPRATERTFAVLERAAATALDAGFHTIVDATFLKHSLRARFAGIAADRGLQHVLLDCTAPESVLRERIANRRSEGSDASEATAAVLDAQLGSHDPLTPAELTNTVRIDTTRAVDAAELARRIDAEAP